jgi:hypothetical protein
LKDYEFKILSIAVLVLCLLVIAMGMRVESLQDELDTEQRHSKASVEDVPAMIPAIEDFKFFVASLLTVTREPASPANTKAILMPISSKNSFITLRFLLHQFLE